MTPFDLRVEYLTNPLAIKSRTPRLSWTIPLEGGRRQTACQIIASTSTDAALWDTGRIESDQSVHVRYAGKPLTSRDRVDWKVRIWDETGAASDYSDTATFEVALAIDDWAANWISAAPRPPADQELTEADQSIASIRGDRRFWPSPHLRRAFQLRTGIASARLSITARGAYEASINGRRIGSTELAPGWTDYHKRIEFQTFDVTDMLTAGDNAIGVILGDSWYSGYVGFNGKREFYGVDPELLAQLEVVYKDGSRDTIVTDNTWRWTYGPILYSDLLEGESYDARRELGAWTEAGYDDRDWQSANAGSGLGSAELEPQIDLPITVTQDLTPKSITALSGGRYLVDMGQNMVGHLRLRVRGEAGTKVTLRHVEMLQPDGEVYITNLRAARQTDEYILSGKGEETFEPRFTFHGFRYVEVAGYPGALMAEDVTGRVVESETETAGEIETGHAMVNQLIKNIVWGQRGNFISVPTDCPQRDERLGWMGDAQVFVRTATFNRNVAPFFTKWLTDVRDAQHDDGIYTDVCPSISFAGKGAPAWTDAGVIVPWTIYQMYGDVDILVASYDSMAKYVDALDAANPDGLWLNNRNNDYGDWLSIEADTPKEVLATAYFAYDALLMSRIAAVLKKEADQKRFVQLFEKIKAAFNKAYVAEDGKIHGDTQTVYLLALQMSLLDPTKRPEAVRRLVADIDAKGGHLSTGFIGVGYLCPILTEYGHADVAYKLLLNETYPSWGYSIAQGATTIWERWDGWTEHKGFQDPGMNSFNHYSLGSVGEWLYRRVAGIDIDPAVPGFKHIVMRPEPCRKLGYVKSAVRSLYGRIESAWCFDGDDWAWDVTVPANTTATAYLPTAILANVDGIGSGAESTVTDGRLCLTLEPGQYSFRVKSPLEAR